MSGPAPAGGAESARRVERLALGISLANLAMLGAVWASGRGGLRPHSLPAFLLVAAAFAVVGSLEMRLYFSQHRASFTLTDAVVVTGLFFLHPLWLGLAAGIGEVAYSLTKRRPALKTLFNASSHGATAAVAALIFALLGGTRGFGAASWVPAFAAVVGWSVLNTASMSAVISRAESTYLERTLAKSLPTAVATTVVAAPVGLLVAELLHFHPLFLLLAVPVALGVSVNNHYAAIQRDEHLRVERLYQATARTSQVSADLDIVSTLAEESRLLVTGTAAVCFLREGDAPWTGRTARPGGVGPARAADIFRVLGEASGCHGTTLVVPVPDTFRSLAPDADVMMLSRSPRGAAVDLVIAVLRERSGGKRTETGVGQTLAAFTAHGAVLAANANLVGELKRSLEAQLEANHRKDEFVATISHELRTPLTVMLGAAQTLVRLEDRLEPGDRTRLLNTAVDQGQRLKVLIEDLLLVAAAEQDTKACELIPLPTDQLVEGFVEDLPAGQLDRVTVDNRAAGSEVLTEPFKARQVVANLIQNAVKYAPGSPIAITIEGRGPVISVSVIDHGPGIPDADRGRVFDRFFQLDQSSTRAQGGTGLGLYICRRLARQLDAGLRLDETPGGGCTFVLSLPCRPQRRSGDSGRGRPPLPATAPGILRRPVLAAHAATPHRDPTEGATR